MKGVDLIIIHSEDGEWEGVYANEVLAAEDHSIRQHDWINLIKFYKNFSGDTKEYTFTEKQMEELGCSLPMSLFDIPKDFFK